MDGPPLSPGSREWAWAATIYEFHRMHTPVEAADGILVLCSHDLRVADAAAELFLQGAGRWICFSGGFGTGPHSGANLNGWTRPEAEIFAERAVELGVPSDRVHVENRAKNTGAFSSGGGARRRPLSQERTSASRARSSTTETCRTSRCSLCRSPSWSGAPTLRSCGSQRPGAHLRGPSPDLLAS